MEQNKTTLKDSKSTRWLMLVILSFTMFAGYLFTEIISPLKPALERVYEWNSADYGFVTSAYAFFNVFFFMLIIVGILLDKLGIRFSTVTSVLIMVAGGTIKYLAFKGVLPTEGEFLGYNLQVFWVAFGYALFGVGVEYAGITVSKSIVKWFKGKELALAMGMQVAIARLGSFVPLAFGAKAEQLWDVPTVIFAGVIFLIIGFSTFLYYNVKDKQLDNQIKIDLGDSEEDKFKISDIGLIISNRGFWLIALLCVLFYGAVFPFYKYGPDLMVNKFGVSNDWAGLLPSLVPFGTMLLTPFFGNIYDKRGKGATIMIIGAVMLIVVHLIFWVPGINSVVIAFFNVILLGIAFSLVPSAMWPSVPKIIPDKQLGSAYALIFWIQNVGLWGIPLLVGIVLNSTNPTIVPKKSTIKESFARAYVEVVKDSEFKGMKDLKGEVIELEDIKRLGNGKGGDLVDLIIEKAPQDDVAMIDSAQLDKLVYNKTKAAMESYLSNLKSEDYNDRNDKNEIVALDEMATKAINVAFSVAKENQVKLNYDYTKTWRIFVGLTFLALFVSLMLKREDKIKGYGLEKPNIDK